MFRMGTSDYPLANNARLCCHLLRMPDIELRICKSELVFSFQSELLSAIFFISEKNAGVKLWSNVDESWEASGLHESFLNSHSPVEREQDLHESWLDITVRLQKLSSKNVKHLRVNEGRSANQTLLIHEFWNTGNKSGMRVNESWLDVLVKRTRTLIKNLNQIKVHESV